MFVITVAVAGILVTPANDIEIAPTVHLVGRLSPLYVVWYVQSEPPPQLHSSASVPTTGSFNILSGAGYVKLLLLELFVLVSVDVWALIEGAKLPKAKIKTAKNKRIFFNAIPPFDVIGYYFINKCQKKVFSIF